MSTVSGAEQLLSDLLELRAVKIGKTLDYSSTDFVPAAQRVSICVIASYSCCLSSSRYNEPVVFVTLLVRQAVTPCDLAVSLDIVGHFCLIRSVAPGLRGG